jgi:hypothetical protein
MAGNADVNLQSCVETVSMQFQSLLILLDRRKRRTVSEKCGSLRDFGDLSTQRNHTSLITVMLREYYERC